MPPKASLPKAPSGLMIALAALTLAAMLFSCLPITTKVEGWPQDLTILVHKNVGFVEVQEKCYPSIPLPCKLMGGFARLGLLLSYGEFALGVPIAAGPFGIHAEGAAAFRQGLCRFAQAVVGVHVAGQRGIQTQCMPHVLNVRATTPRQPY